MPSHAAWSAETAQRLIDERKALPGALLPILHALREAFGYIDRAAVPQVADALNLTRAEVHGVVSFYHDFRDHPPGRHVLKVCRAEACQSMNNEAIDHIKDRLGIDFHQTTPDRSFTLEAVYCLGNCACAPALTLDEKVHGRVDAARFDRLIEGLGSRP